MLTAKSEREDLIVGMDAGADDFIAKPFDKDELRVRLRAGGRVIQLEEDLSRKNHELAEINYRMKRDLEAAADIQNSLLPTEPEGLDGIDVKWRFLPCDELAGDTLNVFNLDDDHLGFYVLDVSGHGVSAALLAMTLSRILSPVLSESSLLRYRNGSQNSYFVNSPSFVANQLNQQFQIDLEYGQYFTLLYGILNKKTNKLRYISAGHPGMIFTSKQSGAEVIKAPDLPIGFSEEHVYEEKSLQLSPGDRIHLYSDGIPEAENSENEYYSTARMVDILKRNANLPLEKSLDMLLESVISWSNPSKLKDDVTLLGIEITDH